MTIDPRPREQPLALSDYPAALEALPDTDLSAGSYRVRFARSA